MVTLMWIGWKRGPKSSNFFTTQQGKWSWQWDPGLWWRQLPLPRAERRGVHADGTHGTPGCQGQRPVKRGNIRPTWVACAPWCVLRVMQGRKKRWCSGVVRGVPPLPSAAAASGFTLTVVFFFIWRSVLHFTISIWTILADPLRAGFSWGLETWNVG